MLALQAFESDHFPIMAPAFHESNTMALQSAFFGPQPRDPPTGRAPPSRPRPPKPPQPRDDGSNRSPNACYGGAPEPKPGKPWPRDPGNGRQYAMGPTGRSMSDKQGSGTGGKGNDKPPRPPKPPVPRDGGKKTRLAMRDPNPRDPGV